MLVRLADMEPMFQILGRVLSQGMLELLQINLRIDFRADTGLPGITSWNRSSAKGLNRLFCSKPPWSQS